MSAATIPATSADVQARIARLFVYPVKSCAGVELTEALLTETGLDLDRAWMVVDAQGRFVSQREVPRMALVKVQLKLHEVVLRAPGMLALHLQIDEVEGPATVQVWDDRVPAFDMGPVAAQWFSDFLGRP
ncbi:MAG: MOSC domain-containing protein, partial [Gammaproteobacteria bacterium]